MSGDALTLGKVVGDVVDQFRRAVPLKIFYNNRLLFNGAGLKPSAVVNRPSVDVGGDDLRTFYTLVMVDPDAPNPSNPTLGEYLHWLVADIPGSTDTNYGRELMTYESPGPAFGIHRMVLVLFRQLGRETDISLGNTIWGCRLPRHTSTARGRGAAAAEDSEANIDIMEQ